MYRKGTPVVLKQRIVMAGLGRTQMDIRAGVRGFLLQECLPPDTCMYVLLESPGMSISVQATRNHFDVIDQESDRCHI